jgi:hypothetical protein
VSRRRRRIFAFDRLPHQASRRLRISRRLALDLLKLIRQLVVLGRFTNPSRIVIRLEVVEPGVVVHAVRHLHENGQVLRPQVEGVRRTAEIEALVLAKRALGIFPDVALGLLGRRVGLDDLRPVACASPPEKRLALAERRLRQFGCRN